MDNETEIIAIGFSVLPRTDRLKYIRWMLSTDGELRYESASRISATRMKWRSTAGVSCDRPIKERLKCKIALYGFESASRPIVSGN